MEKAEERRRSARFKTPFCIECKHPDYEQTFSGAIKDVSMTGACVLVDTQSDLPADKPTLLSLIFPDTTLNIQSKVVWQKKVSDKNKVGLTFTKMPDSFKNDIYESVFKYHRDQVTSRWWDF